MVSPRDGDHEPYRIAAGRFTIVLMAQSAFPVATDPRTITVRVRTVVIAAVVLAAIGLVWWALSWVSGMQPLAAGSFATQPIGLPVAAPAPAYVDGPAAYRWKRGGRYIVQMDFHNSASVPVTVTGVDGTGPDWVGPLAGPRLRNSSMNMRLQRGSFHAVRIPADGDRVIALVFYANPHAICEKAGGSMTAGVATVHFTTLGVFDETQVVPLGSAEAVMTDRRC
jgi:hypothetical protein